MTNWFSRACDRMLSKSDSRSQLEQLRVRMITDYLLTVKRLWPRRRARYIRHEIRRNLEMARVMRRVSFREDI